MVENVTFRTLAILRYIDQYPLRSTPKSPCNRTEIANCLSQHSIDLHCRAPFAYNIKSEKLLVRMGQVPRALKTDNTFFLGWSIPSSILQYPLHSTPKRSRNPKVMAKSEWPRLPSIDLHCRARFLYHIKSMKQLFRMGPVASVKV